MGAKAASGRHTDSLHQESDSSAPQTSTVWLWCHDVGIEGTHPFASEPQGRHSGKRLLLANSFNAVDLLAHSIITCSDGSSKAVFCEGQVTAWQVRSKKVRRPKTLLGIEAGPAPRRMIIKCIQALVLPTYPGESPRGEGCSAVLMSRTRRAATALPGRDGSGIGPTARTDAALSSLPSTYVPTCAPSCPEKWRSHAVRPEDDAPPPLLI